MKSGVWVMIMIVVAALSFLIGYSLAPRYDAPGKVSTSGAPGGSGGGYGTEDTGGYGTEDSGGYGAEDTGGYGVQEESGGYGAEAESGGYGAEAESGGYGQ
jgi:hypothetical protein